MVKYRLLVILTLAVIAFLLVSSPDKEKFDPQRWRQTPEHMRGPMARDIVDSELLIGTSHGAVQILLGKPASRFVETRWEYLLGRGSGFAFVWFMLVEFDERGRVVEVSINYD
jgi:hypothetical protein